MPANTIPIFSSLPILGQNLIASGNTDRGLGTGAYYPLASGASFGTRIEFINIKATGVTVAGMVRFFIDNSGAANPPYPNSGMRLWAEVPVTAISASSVTSSFSSEIVRPDGRPVLILPSGQILKVTAEQPGFNVFAHGGDF